MSKYIDNLNPIIKEYYGILSEDFPEFLHEYIETPRMQKQDKIRIETSLLCLLTRFFNIPTASERFTQINDCIQLILQGIC